MVDQPKRPSPERLADLRYQHDPGDGFRYVLDREEQGELFDEINALSDELAFALQQRDEWIDKHSELEQERDRVARAAGIETQYSWTVDDTLGQIATRIKERDEAQARLAEARSLIGRLADAYDAARAPAQGMTLLLDASSFLAEREGE